MPIANVDQLIAGFRPGHFFHKALTGTMVVGRPHSTWYQAGIPGAGAAPGAALNGANYDSTSALVNGQIPFYNEDDAYLARFAGQMIGGGHMLLCDRLWANGGINITSTSPQAISSPTWPTRDADGAIDGRGVLLGVEVSAQTGAGTPTLTVTYNNSTLTGGTRTGTNAFNTAASSIVGTFYPIGLQAGDVGVQSVASITLSTTWTSGTIHVVAYRVIAAIPCMASYLGNAIDFLTGGGPRMYDGSVPWIVLQPQATTSGYSMGHIVTAHG